MGATVEIVARAQVLVGHCTDAGHDAHVEHHHDGVGDFHTHLGQRRTGRAHEVGDDIKRAAFHAAGENAVELGIHLGGSGPVVGGAYFILARGADEGEVFHTGNVVRIGPSVVAAGKFFLVELNEDAVFDREIVKVGFFRLGAIDPENLVGLGQFRRGADEFEDGLIGGLCGAEVHMFFVFARETLVGERAVDYAFFALFSPRMAKMSGSLQFDQTAF